MDRLAWFEPLPGAALMRATDRWAIERCGIPSLELMERAGSGLARVAAAYLPAGGRLAIVCGKGNNGGDGLVAARLLRASGHTVAVLATWTDPGELSADAATQLARLTGAPPRAFEPALLDGAAGIVDALLGTGFVGAPRGAVGDAIAALAAGSAPVVAADVPSGVDSDSGVVAGVAVRAVATATFHAAKPGLWIAPGKAHAGVIEVINIGIPADAPPTAATPPRPTATRPRSPRTHPTLQPPRSPRTPQDGRPPRPGSV